jgi:hypothetical protein
MKVENYFFQTFQVYFQENKKKAKAEGYFFRDLTSCRGLVKFMNFLVKLHVK